MASFSGKEIESRGPTVDAAVAAGLLRLGLERNDVDVIVIDEGSRGLLGIGSREAIVRLIANLPAAAPSPATPPPAPPKPIVKQAPPPSKPASKQSAPAEHDDDGESTVPADTTEELEDEQQAAVEVLSALLEKMRVDAEISSYVTEPDDLTSQRVNIVDIKGEDLGILIGPRGETLDSLQFLSRLMVAHKLHRRANFVVDVEGFRKRREQALTRLAERMADKARQRNEPITLEPMSAYERRIIHMTLRDSSDVYTESTGEGKQRRVRIFPKK
ncbi:MAG: protein jag [Anaerolineae bacterium]|nr:protein jag [Promineifilum sp.]MCZ2114307.1 protein jag [Anaerolineae bacterium]HNS38616.1 RNA-binding cell elongation regulator Jag/EloR [Promineifilum sp.]